MGYSKINKLVTSLSKKEGGKVGANAGQLREFLKVLAIEIKEKPLETITTLLDYAKKIKPV